MAEGDQLAAMLARRAKINEGEAVPASQKAAPFNPYTEFPELSRKEIKEYEKMFKKYDTGADGFIDLQELKYLMEQLKAPQTHVALKAMIAEVDEDFDGRVSYREFLLIFKLAAGGKLKCEGLAAIAKSIDVSEAGVGGAKGFFESKAAETAKGSKFEAEIKAEQAAKKLEAEAAKKRKEEFKAKMSQFH